MRGDQVAFDHAQARSGALQDDRILRGLLLGQMKRPPPSRD
jgi:hypothetical protein